MTIGDMLRLHGNPARRYVLPSGRIAFGAAATSQVWLFPHIRFTEESSRRRLPRPTLHGGWMRRSWPMKSPKWGSTSRTSTS